MKLNVSPLVQRFLDGTATASEVAEAIATERLTVSPKPTGYYELEEWDGYPFGTQADLDNLEAYGVLSYAEIKPILMEAGHIIRQRKAAAE
ncbi:hypothetical protein J5O04_02900 [Corynebacterium hindlerae]|uniref:hypothetical protein n=1 Tax=Corynebacterium hindlerae TaxID=699041 RepID=UPI001AD7CB52|nr:hypothetical protein [Corynebacterium hindlerae]QTH60099.1 hypothetical protein J5O04_02900 [Corynebacterium hindlerae]